MFILRGICAAPMAQSAESSYPAEKAGYLPLKRHADDGEAACVEALLTSLESPITPTDQYFVRSHFPVPEVDAASWRLMVDGDVETPLSLSLADLSKFAEREIVVTTECAGNSRASMTPRAEGVLWGHGAVGTARWSGVPLTEILQRAHPRNSVCEVVLTGADRGTEAGADGQLSFEMSIPIEKALHRETLLARSMNGRALEPRHGYPLRVVVPGWYGMASVKWLTRIQAVSTPFEGFFRRRAYAYIPEGAPSRASIVPAQESRIKSLITGPSEHDVLAPGRHTVRGVAWCGDAAVRSVEVSCSSPSDAGANWLQARLAPATSPYAWIRWEAEVELPTEGFVTVRARATDDRGRAQPSVADWNYRGLGNNAIHCVPIEVRDRRTT